MTRRLKFRGGAIKMMEDQSREVVLAGQAGTGKSVACLFKLHILCENKPGLRALMLRKTRTSLSESAMVTYERDVNPPDRAISRTHRESYRYDNGSEIVIGGLDNSSKLFSAEYDIIYVQEAIELSESDWELLFRALRGTALSYKQVIADTNPDAPTHWIKQRANAGTLNLIESRHEDNPRYFNSDGTPTAEGEQYISYLDAMTGPRYWRMRHGRWVQAEGVVYEGWDAARHVIDRFDIPADWKRYMAVDFGYTNPFVCQWWAEDGDGRLYRYREIYRCKTLVEDHAKVILDCMGWTITGTKLHRSRNDADPLPNAIVCDHDAEDRATLERHLMLSTIAAQKSVSDGIQEVASRLRPAGDGKPRIFFMRDSLVSQDQELVETKRPLCTEQEFDGYVWDLDNKRTHGEVPIKENDHGADCVKYMCMHLRTSLYEPAKALGGEKKDNRRSPYQRSRARR